MNRATTALGIACLLVVSGAPLAAANLIQNGDFELGLAGWNRLDQIGSEGTFFVQSGTSSPVNMLPVPGPPGGTNAAMTDAAAGGSHVLYQDFVVPTAVTSANILFSLFVQNLGDRFYTPNHLDWARASTPPLENLNQRARVDIVSTAADLFSVNAADILLNLFETQPTDPLVSGYTTYAIDITSLLQTYAGQTLRLRFAEVDNVAPFNFGVDNVSINSPAVAPIPEPGTWSLLVCAISALPLLRRK